MIPDDETHTHLLSPSWWQYFFVLEQKQNKLCVSVANQSPSGDPGNSRVVVVSWPFSRPKMKRWEGGFLRGGLPPLSSWCNEIDVLPKMMMGGEELELFRRWPSHIFLTCCSCSRRDTVEIFSMMRVVPLKISLDLYLSFTSSLTDPERERRKKNNSCHAFERNILNFRPFVNNDLLSFRSSYNPFYISGIELQINVADPSNRPNSQSDILGP